MENNILLVSASLALLLLVGSDAAAPPSEVYWQTKLPNTRMPKALHHLLPSVAENSERRSFKDNAVTVGVGVDNNGNDGYGVGNTGNDGNGHGGVSVGVGQKGGPHVWVYPPYYWGPKPWHSPYYWGPKPWHPPYYWGPRPFQYNYAASKDQLHDNPNVALFFFEKDLYPGKKMNIHFTKTMPADAKFLPRQVAESIPFSSSKFPEILNQLSVQPNSEEADIMKETIKECEEPGLEGEDKYCATSLEAMVDFSTSKLGNNVQVLATEVDKDQRKLQEFSIVKVEKTAGNAAVACHGQNYAYPVYFCHVTDNTRSYMVHMVGAADQTKAKAVAVCHTDTSKWNPNHLAFKVLGVKPGTVPVCHFLPEDHIVWVPK